MMGLGSWADQGLPKDQRRTKHYGPPKDQVLRTKDH